MQLIQRLRNLLLAGLIGTSFSATAAVVAGKDYLPLNPPQPTESGNKIEVLEAFSYGCSHCAEFEPKLAPWVKSQPADVNFRRLPVTFNREPWANLARAYYSLDALGQLDKLHPKVFEAMHKEGVNLTDQQTLTDWMAKQGIDKKKFGDTFKSFGVQTKVQRIPQLTKAYMVEGVPTIIVAGKYRTSTDLTGTYENLLRVTSELIDLARKQQAGAPAKH